MSMEKTTRYGSILLIHSSANTVISSSGRVKPIAERAFALLPNLRIACHYTPNPINYDLRNKSIPELVPLITASAGFSCYVCRSANI